jgi:hypothetical protein
MNLVDGPAPPVAAGATNKVLLLQGPLKSSGRDYFTSFAMYRRLMTEQEALVDYDATANILRLAYFFRQLGYRIVYTGWEADREALQAIAGQFDLLQLIEPVSVRDPSSFALIKNNRVLMYQAIDSGATAARQAWGDDALCLRLRSDLWLQPFLVDRYVRLLAADENAGALLVSHINRADLRSMPDFIFGARAAVLSGLFSALYQRALAGQSHSSHVHFDIMSELVQQKPAISSVLTCRREVLESFVWRGCPFLPFLGEMDPSYMTMANFEHDKRFSL